MHCRIGIGCSPLFVGSTLVAGGYSPLEALELLRRRHFSTELNLERQQALRSLHAARTRQA